MLDCTSGSDVLWWLACVSSSGWLPAQTFNLGKLKNISTQKSKSAISVWICCIVVFFLSIILVFGLFKNILEADPVPPLTMDQILFNCVCFGWSGQIKIRAIFEKANKKMQINVSSMVSSNFTPKTCSSDSSNHVFLNWNSK